MKQSEEKEGRKEERKEGRFSIHFKILIREELTQRDGLDITTSQGRGEGLWKAAAPNERSRLCTRAVMIPFIFGAGIGITVVTKEPDPDPIPRWNRLQEWNRIQSWNRLQGWNRFLK